GGASGSLCFAVATGTTVTGTPVTRSGTGSAFACTDAFDGHCNSDFEIMVLPAYQHFRPSIRRQDQYAVAFDGRATLHSMAFAFAAPTGASAAMQATRKTGRICVFIEHPC